MRKKILFTIISFVSFLLTIYGQDKTNKPVPQLGKNTIKEVIAAMSLEEKCKMVVGTGMRMGGGPVVGETQNKVSGAAGTTYGIPRLGIPAIVLVDGPAGVRINPIRNNDSATTYYCTAFPVSTLLASTWDPGQVKKVGEAMGNEVLEYGADVLLAPALNIHRNPLGGRNFEYYSEDPLISGKIAAAMVKGVQSEGVGTSVKHFAANNQETNRNTINTIISERALREIYLEGFRITVQESDPWTIMSSYNKINESYTSESSDLLTTILRKEWGFKNFVMTDWFGGKDPVAQMKAWNDLLEPGTPDQSRKIMEAVHNKTLDEAILDRNIEKILSIVLKSPAFKNYKYSNKPDLKGHAQIARAAAAEGMVLLKNEGKTLPVTGTVKKVAVFGNTSYDIITGGKGSGDVNKAYSISLVEGLKNGGLGFDNNLGNAYDQYLLQEKARQPKTRGFMGLPPVIMQMPLDKNMLAELAASNDLALLTIGRISGEFQDRKLDGDYYLNDSEKELIRNTSEAFHAKGKKLVVILNIGGVIEIASWKDYADAILLAWQPGQEAGNAITDVLTGKVNPSGKLATTFPADYKQVPSAKNFPGTPENKPTEVVYEEGIYTGYRYYDSFGVAPTYEFGYGLSYTNFSLGGLKVSSAKFTDKITVTVEVTNTGTIAGKEVVQLYLSAPAVALNKPEKELKAFEKTRLLKPGEKQTISFELNARALSSFNQAKSAWIAESGKYTIRLGTSSRNLPQTGNFTLAKEIVAEKTNKALAPSREIKELVK